MISRFFWALVLALMLFPQVNEAEARGKRPSGRSADDAFTELDDGLRLHFFDAVSGKPIRGAQIGFGDQLSSTDRLGTVSFDMPTGLGEEDTLHGTFRADGYVSSKFEVHFMVGVLFLNRYSMSPALEPGPLRVVLDWAESPSDLDAHLVKEGQYHISYRDKVKVEDHAWLDRDDLDGHGPETITLLTPNDDATYSFFVHDFTNRTKTSSDGLSKSRARVTVYTASGLLKTFRAPADLRGDTWQVFRVIGGRVTAP
jgi:hypothetical protein